MPDWPHNFEGEAVSSEHIIIVARNRETGVIELPLDDLTLYWLDGAQDVLETVRKSYSDDWVLALYSPVGGFYSGAKKPNTAPPSPAQ